ncbi:glycoside hydrolase family 10 protein [Hymenobacter cellulosivorans]|uniref:Family 10 glycosylhydrolase n=1 Tax=Hymenobacter cellulosivorans TaxID=2932249 RepID=A0ABY4F7M7_9BACT|nr:family 10 glycosylhydrolase [Hymenobacter cellulosivorans]UOQ52675.1 family 10 glycosylhydrolase [Hymenobacter cellulosivorans]
MFRLTAAGRPFALWFACFLILLGLDRPLRAQDGPPKRELRGVWIATVENIDWPSSRTLTPEQQRREYRRILDVQQRNGINAVFVQVRPAADAFYQSELEPWSKWLTGQQGKAPSPAYDPLPFLIEEAHARGMEFHAWFNPYRASMDSVTRRLAPNHPFKQHPEWFLRFGGKLLFNPGLPEVRNYITQVILDVVRRYDIDGVHFDDYFYPYPEPGLKIHDEAAFQLYNPDSLKLADWRRQNVNKLIQGLHDTIQGTKRWVKFGISPFGVWMNKSAHPEGSDTRAGQPSYANLYADSRLWLQEGWIDYIVPQLYWSTNFKLVPYATLLEWWTRNHFDRHLYIGQGAYRMLENTRSDTTWRNPRELPRQVRLNRSYPTEVSGSVFFSARSLMANPLHTRDSLRQNLFRYPALVPTMPWMDAVPPRPAQNLVLARAGAVTTLSWQSGPVAADGDVARYFVVYRFTKDQQPTPDDPRNIVALVQNRPGTAPTLVDTSATPGTDYAYYLTAVDRLHNESTPIRVTTQGKAAEVIVAQTPAPATAPPASARPVPTPSPTVDSETAEVTKVKVKTKKRGFFGRLFGKK